MYLNLRATSSQGHFFSHKGVLWKEDPQNYNFLLQKSLFLCVQVKEKGWTQHPHVELFGLMLPNKLIILAGLSINFESRGQMRNSRWPGYFGCQVVL